ncbi:MAG: hypothetical protein WA209_07790 [Candidatus Acidiferrales bacterium]
MIRPSHKALIAAFFTVLAFVVLAPAASADSGQFDANGGQFALNSFTVSGQTVDADFQIGSGAVALFLEGAIGDLNTISIVSNGVSYTFTGVKISEWSLGGNGLNIDFKLASETSSAAVPEPALTFLVGCGLLALAITSTRRMLQA